MECGILIILMLRIERPVIRAVDSVYIVNNTELIVQDTASFSSILFMIEAGQIKT